MHLLGPTMFMSFDDAVLSGELIQVFQSEPTAYAPSIIQPEVIIVGGNYSTSQVIVIKGIAKNCSELFSKANSHLLHVMLCLTTKQASKLPYLYSAVVFH